MKGSLSKRPEYQMTNDGPVAVAGPVETTQQRNEVMSKDLHLPESWLTCECRGCKTWRTHCEAITAKLKEFARDIIADECWDLGGSQSRDGADVQEWALKLGLIVKGKATKEQADNSGGLFEEGDEICKFAEILA